MDFKQKSKIIHLPASPYLPPHTCFMMQKHRHLCVHKHKQTHNGKDSVNELKNGNHHFIFIFCGRPALVLNKIRYFNAKFWINKLSNSQKLYLSSGWVQEWIITFMSKYKLSNSTPFGLGKDVSIGRRRPSGSSRP